MRRRASAPGTRGDAERAVFASMRRHKRSLGYASRRARPLAPRGRHRCAALCRMPAGSAPPPPGLSRLVLQCPSDGLSWSFASYSDYRQAEARKTEAIQKLDTEIAGRLLGARAVVDHMVSRLRQGSAFYVRPYVFAEVVNALDMSGGAPRKGVYPELRDRSLRSLLIELRRLASESQQGDLKAATTAYMSLQSHANVGSSAGTVLGTPARRSLLVQGIPSYRCGSLPKWRPISTSC